VRWYHWELHTYRVNTMSSGVSYHKLHSSGSFLGSDTQSMAKLMATYRATLNGKMITGVRWRLHQAEKVVGDIEGRVYLKQRKTRGNTKNVNPKTYLFVGKKVSS